MKNTSDVFKISELSFTFWKASYMNGMDQVLWSGLKEFLLDNYIKTIEKEYCNKDIKKNVKYLKKNLKKK